IITGKSTSTQRSFRGTSRRHARASSPHARFTTRSTFSRLMRSRIISSNTAVRVIIAHAIDRPCLISSTIAWPRSPARRRANGSLKIASGRSVSIARYTATHRAVSETCSIAMRSLPVRTSSFDTPVDAEPRPRVSVRARHILRLCLIQTVTRSEPFPSDREPHLILGHERSLLHVSARAKQRPDKKLIARDAVDRGIGEEGNLGSRRLRHRLPGMLQAKSATHANPGSRLGKDVAQRHTGVRLHIAAERLARAGHEHRLRTVVRKDDPWLERQLYHPVVRAVEGRCDRVERVLHRLAERSGTRDAYGDAGFVEPVRFGDARRFLHVEPAGVRPRSREVYRVAGHELAGVDVLADRIRVRRARGVALVARRRGAVQPSLPRRGVEEHERAANTAGVLLVGSPVRSLPEIKRVVVGSHAYRLKLLGTRVPGGHRGHEHDDRRTFTCAPQFAGGFCFSQTKRRRKSPILPKVVTQRLWIIDSCRSSGITVNS